MINNPSCTIYSIYCITNLINGKKYIGFSKNPEKRYKWHIKGSGCTISKAIQKYGKDNFKFEVILQGLERDHILDMESHFINEYNTFGNNNGYNMTTGGEGTFGFNHSEETKKKLSEIFSGPNSPNFGKIPWNKGKTHSDEAKRKISLVHKGKPKSEEWKKQMSMRVAGSNNPAFGKPRNPTTTMLGKRHSEETKLKQSIAQKGLPSPFKGMLRYHNPVTKENKYFFLNEEPIGYIRGFYKK